MLRRQRAETRGESGAAAPGRRLLIAAAGEHVCDTYGHLLSTRRFDVVGCRLTDVVTAAADDLYDCAVVVGTGPEESAAISQVDHMRHDENQQVRRTAAVLLASSGRNQIYAWESGVDGFVILPADLEEIVETLEDVLARPRLDRYDHRQAQIRRLRRGV